MSSSRRRGRPVPRKARGPRPGPAPAGATSDAELAPTSPSGRPASRAQNRAAKRAATPTRPVRGRGSGRSGGSPSNVALIALAVVAVAIGAAVIAFGNPFGAPTPSGSAAPSGAGSPAVYGDGSCPTSQPASLAAGEKRTVTIETEKGNIVIEVDGSRAPIATGNFIALIGCKYYDGVVFHRLVPGFVIQGGDPDGTGSGPGPGYSIADDPLVGTYHRGTVAMARTSQPNSQGSQFFIVLSDSANSALTDPSVLYPYAILGEVTSGMDVVDQIAAMPNSGPPGNDAVDPVAMTRVTVTPAGAPPSAGASPSGGLSPGPGASPTAPTQ